MGKRMIAAGLAMLTLLLPAARPANADPWGTLSAFIVNGRCNHPRHCPLSGMVALTRFGSTQAVSHQGYVNWRVVRGEYRVTVAVPGWTCPAEDLLLEGTVRRVYVCR